MKSIMEEASTITKAIENAWNRAGQPQEFTVKILELPKTSFFGLKTSKSAKIALLFNEMMVKAKEQPQKQNRPVGQRPYPERKDQRDQRETHGDRNQQAQRRPLPQREGQRDSRDQQRDAQPRPERPHDNRHGAPRSADMRDQRRPQPNQRPAQRSPYRTEEQMPDESRRHDRAPERTHERGPERSHERSMERPQERSFERDNWTPEMVESAQDWIKETLVMMGKPDIKINSQISHNYLKLYLDQPVMDDFKQEETQLKSWGSLAMEAVREKANKPLRSLRIVLESNPSRRS